MAGAEAVPILGSSLVQWLSVYGYWVMFPLLVIEGPIVGFTAGVLISYGVFNPIAVFVVFVLATTVTDTIIFFTARYSETFLRTFKYPKKIIAAIRAEQDTEERGWTDQLEDHFLKFFLFAKIAPTVAVTEILIIAAAILRIPTRKIYIGNLFGQPVWSAAVLAFGFYFGRTLQDASFLLNTASTVMTSLIIFLLIYIIFYDELIADTAFGKMITSIKEYDYQQHLNENLIQNKQEADAK